MTFYDDAEMWQRCNHCGWVGTIDEWEVAGMPDNFLCCPSCLRLGADSLDISDRCLKLNI